MLSVLKKIPISRSPNLHSLCCFRFDVATLRTLLSLRHFEAEIQFVPVEDPEDVLRKKEKCFNRSVPTVHYTHMSKKEIV